MSRASRSGDRSVPGRGPRRGAGGAVVPGGLKARRPKAERLPVENRPRAATPLAFGRQSRAVLLRERQKPVPDEGSQFEATCAARRRAWTGPKGSQSKMMRRTNQSGFTLIELMIVVAIIAIIAAIAIPRLMSARLSANEAAAISTLRSVSSAQAQIQSSNAVDTDADGAGESAYFAELAGRIPLRVPFGVPAVPAAGAATDILNPAILSSAFGNMTASPAGGIVSRQGYFFQMWLPNATGAAGLIP